MKPQLDHDYKFGVVLFDDPRPEGGWACVAGGKPDRIRSIGDLASDTRWWTNLTYPDFSQYIGMKTPMFKKAEYLRTSLPNLAAEIGMVDRLATRAVAAQVLSKIFDRVMRLAHKNYGIGGADRDGKRLAELTLADELYKVIISPDRSISPEIDKAAELAWENGARCINGLRRNAGVYTRFMRSRIMNAMEVVSTPVPSAQWEFLPDDKLPPAKRRIEWLLSLGQPILARTTVSKVRPEYQAVLPIGGSRNNSRGWMTHPELLLMARMSDVRVEGAFIASRYESLEPRIRLDVGGQVGPLSISHGLLAECYVAALTMGHYRGGHSDRLFAPRAAWLAAAERFHCFLAAGLMSNNGFSVAYYGQGSVHVMVPDGALKDACDVAANAGLLPPLTVASDIATKMAHA